MVQLVQGGPELSHRSTFDGRVMILEGSKVLKTFSGKKAQRVLSEIEAADPEDLQFVLQRVLGGGKVHSKPSLSLV